MMWFSLSRGGMEGFYSDAFASCEYKRLNVVLWRKKFGAHKLQMAAGKVAHATLKGPSVVKEICIGFALGLVAGGLWKMHHWNEQRKVRAFYDMLEKGQISVVVEE